MAITISPSAIPNAKKNAFYDLLFIPSGTGQAPYSWALTSGALPAWMSWEQINAPGLFVTPTSGVNSGKVTAVRALHLFGIVPSALLVSGASLTFTVTDSTPSTPLTATVTTSTSGTIVDGPDPEGYHATETGRANVLTQDEFLRGDDNVSSGHMMTVADALARQWPLSPPAQNS